MVFLSASGDICNRENRLDEIKAEAYNRYCLTGIEQNRRAKRYEAKE